MKQLFISVLFVFTLSTSIAQKSKVQAAWRALSDYEESQKDGNPEMKYLGKAKEAIDIALTNEATAKQAKTLAYKTRISYAQFQSNLTNEIKRLEPSIQDKNERAITAYGNVSLTEFDEANQALNAIRDNDPKYLDRIQEAIVKGTSDLDEDELKFATAVQQMKMESGNIASGKYKAKKYDEAADYFFKTAMINSVLLKTKDTANFYNACIAASKAKNSEKILEYNKKMIDAKIASPYNYESLFNVYIQKGDSATAIDALKKGRAEFPADASLLTEETNLFLASGRQQEALSNLQLSVQREPKNALYHFIIGNIYENMANPKDKSGDKPAARPANFNELFKNAETSYLKAIEINPTNQEYLYNSLFNLGAMYYNYGDYLANRKPEKGADVIKVQKQYELQAQEYYKKSVPHLERALNIRADDRATMTALRRIYKLTGDEARAKEMSDKLKALK